MSLKKNLLFSVILATRNRENSLRKALQCLHRQQYPRSRFEILVVDNGSTDLTCDRVKKLQVQITNLTYRFLSEPNVSASRNLGAAEAQGAWLAFTDDDCLPPCDWLAQAAWVIQKYPTIRIAGGPIFDVIPSGAKIPTSFEPAGWAQSYGRKPRFLKTNEYFTECNLFVQRKEFLTSGGFDVRIGPGNQRFGFHEGTELQSRIDLRVQSKKVRYYDPGIQMRHLVRPARSEPWARVRRSFVSGFDHARAFPQMQKHNVFFLSLRAHAATVGLLASVIFGLIPSTRISAGLNRFTFRCGEMWGELFRQVNYFSTHRPARRLPRSLPRKILDWSLPWLKQITAQAGASNVQKRMSLASKGFHSGVGGIVSHCRLPIHDSFYRLPSEATPPAHPLLAHIPFHRSPAGWRVVLRGAKVYGPTPAVLTRDNTLIDEASRDWGKEGIQLGILRALALPPQQEVTGKVFIAACLGGETFYHWLTDVVPMLLEEQRQSHGLESFGTFLTHDPIKAFHRETFQALGIPLEKIKTLTKRKGFRCAELTLHTCHHVSGRPPLETLCRVARLFQPNPPSLRPSKKITILRSTEMSRPLVHRQKILSLLASRGYEEYEPGRDPIATQAEVFASCKTIVATHGAALTNLIFCQPGTTVVELFSARYVNPCYAHICQQMGLRHIPLLDDTVPKGVNYQLANANVPITVSPDKLGRVVAKI